MLKSRLRTFVDLLEGTPLHPHWLMRGTSFSDHVLASRVSGLVLDVGCSARWVQERLTSDCTYIGLDYPATGLNMYGARPDVFADASELPFADESIDTVVLFETLEKVARPKQAVREVARVLKPGRYLLPKVLFLYPLHDEPSDCTGYMIHDLQRLMQDIGLPFERIKQSMWSAEIAGLFVALSLAGMTMQAVRDRSPGMVFVPLTALAILISNVIFWTVGRLMPSWPDVPAGYQVIARK